MLLGNAYTNKVTRDCIYRVITKVQTELKTKLRALLPLCTYLEIFHASVGWWFSTRILSDSKSPQVSKTLLSILADFNNAVVLIVFICPPISKSFSPCTYPLMTVPSAPITIGITVTFMFNRFSIYLARSMYFISLFNYYYFTLCDISYQF